MIKAKFGTAIRSKGETAQINELDYWTPPADAVRYFPRAALIRCMSSGL